MHSISSLQSKLCMNNHTMLDNESKRNINKRSLRRTNVQAFLDKPVRLQPSSRNAVTSSLRRAAMSSAIADIAEMMRLEFFTKGKDWLESFHHLDPRFQILNFFNDLSLEGVENFESSGGIRKLSGLFSSAFDGNKIKEYNTQDTLKVFKATIFSIRNNALPKSVPGWVITDKEDIDWLGGLFEKEVDITNF